MSEKFKKGDVVRLKSGSPAMTVYGYTTGTERDGFSTDVPVGWVMCKQWLDGIGEHNSAYDPDLLEKIDGDRTPPAGY